jgi:hypothetical protein
MPTINTRHKIIDITKRMIMLDEEKKLIKKHCYFFSSNDLEDIKKYIVKHKIKKGYVQINYYNKIISIIEKPNNYIIFKDCTYCYNMLVLFPITAFIEHSNEELILKYNQHINKKSRLISNMIYLIHKKGLKSM